MKVEYEAICRIVLGKTIQPVRDVENDINNHLSEMGFSERISIGSEVSLLTATTDREMSDEELKMMGEKFKECLEQRENKKLSIEFVEFRRKSGNVQQSVL